MAKLLIWDLDDTLWSGTLAEGEDVVLYERRAELIRSLNSKGVVNSICSKNDFETAKSKLVSMGLWDEFVFPEIEFLPKGRLVAGVISDMQLRAPDVVFIDDNELNLKEVEFENPGIRTIDARGSAVDDFLEELEEKLSTVSKSRVQEYRILEKKRADRKGAGGANDDFLASCGIRVSLVRRTDNLPYASRIEELINRTNQLNFTKSRVEEGSVAEYILDVRNNETYGVFVWDKYGYYGLVGFVSIEGRSKLRHFLFSCRTMNMGVEVAVAASLAKYFEGVTTWPVSTEMPAWIKFVSSDSKEFREAVGSGEPSESAEILVRVMANCQSGAICHYMGILGVSFDNWPRVYRLQDSLSSGLEGEIPKFLVYGAFNDYDLRHWDTAPSDADYRVAAANLLMQTSSAGAKLIVILPPDEFVSERVEDGVTCKRFQFLNSVWRELAVANSDLQLVSVGNEFLRDVLVEDPRHYDRATLLWLGGRIRKLISTK